MLNTENHNCLLSAHYISTAIVNQVVLKDKEFVLTFWFTSLNSDFHRNYSFWFSYISIVNNECYVLQSMLYIQIYFLCVFKIHITSIIAWGWGIIQAEWGHEGVDLITWLQYQKEKELSWPGMKLSTLSHQSEKIICLLFKPFNL